MISRSLGPALGGAIGVLFAIGNGVAVALYIVGFCETLIDNIGQGHVFEDLVNEIRLYGMLLLTFLISMALIGVGWVVKLNMVLLVLITVTIICFVIGAFIKTPDLEAGFTGLGDSQFMANLGPGYTEGFDFFYVFAVFFPAVTGIMAGANISDQLEDPSVAIPMGTLSAVGGSMLVYLALAMIIGAAGERWALIENVLLMADMCLSPYLVYAGVYAATFSSALASLVGAPRILNAVACDKLIPALEIFATYEGEPRKAYVFAFVIASICILIGDLNVIAPLISMFFMMTYAMINFACFELSQTKSPGWRPAFTYYTWYTALFGCICCIVCMFLTDEVSAILSALIGFGLYKYISYRNPQVNWGSAIEAVHELQTVRQLMRMRTHKRNPKNFRPSYLVFGKTISSEASIVNFMTTFRYGYGATIYGKVVVGDIDGKESRDTIGKFCHTFRPNDRTYGYLDPKLDADGQALLSSEPGRKLKALSHIPEIEEQEQDHDQTETDAMSGIANTFVAPIELKSLTRQNRVDSSSVDPDASALLDEDVASSSNQNALIHKKKAFLDVVLAGNFREGVRMLIQTSGLGAMRPNTTVYGYMEDYKTKNIKEVTSYVGALRDSFYYNMNTMVLRGHEQLDYTESPKGEHIDIWWLVEDGGVTVLIPYLLSQHNYWKMKKGASAKMRLLVIVQSGTSKENKDEMKEQLQSFMANLRFAKWSVKVVENVTQPSEQDTLVYNSIIAKTPLNEQPVNMQKRSKKWLQFSETINAESRGAKLVVITIPVPRAHFNPYTYLSWLALLTKGFYKAGVPVILMRGNGVNVLTSE